jgi:predicted nucleotidyltransferase
MADRADSPRLLRVLRAVAALLDEQGAPWALVGGLAVSVRAEPRFTRDIDLAVAVDDDADAERLIRELTAHGFRMLMSLEQNALKRLATVRLLPPDEAEEGIVVDLLFASSGIEAEICRDADAVEIAPGLLTPVAQVGHLVALKVLALAPDRLQDAVDLHALAGLMTDAERQRAKNAVERITAIGAHRGKALDAELRRWVAP